jgi:predicted CopG family antitoxin
MKRKRNGLRIMMRKQPLVQERELKTQRQPVSESRKIRSVLKTWD